MHSDTVALKEVLRRCGRIPPDHTLRIVGQLADQLDARHRNGLVHTGLTLAGIAIDTDGTARITAARVPGDAAEIQSELTALAEITYRCLTGTAPPADGPVSPAVVALPPAVGQLVARSLDPNAEPLPAARFARLCRDAAVGLPSSDPLPLSPIPGVTTDPAMTAVMPVISETEAAQPITTEPPAPEPSPTSKPSPVPRPRPAPTPAPDEPDTTVESEPAAEPRAAVPSAPENPARPRRSAALPVLAVAILLVVGLIVWNPWQDGQGTLLAGAPADSSPSPADESVAPSSAEPSAPTPADPETSEEPEETEDPGTQPAGGMPNVVGMNYSEAGRTVFMAGFTSISGQFDEYSDQPPCTVLSQDPAPGTPASPEVDVVLVSSGDSRTCWPY